MSGVVIDKQINSPRSTDSGQSNQRPADSFAKMTADFQRDNKMRLKQVRNLEELIQFKVKAVPPQDLFGMKRLKHSLLNMPEPPVIDKTISGAGKPPTLKEVREDPVKYLKLYFNNDQPRKSYVVHDLNPIMRRYQKEQNSVSPSPMPRISETVQASYNDFKEKIESLKKFDQQSPLQNHISSNMSELRNNNAQKFDYVSNNQTMTEVRQLRHKLTKVFTEDNDTDDAPEYKDLQRSQNFGTSKYSVSLTNLPKVFDQRTDYQPAEAQKSIPKNRVSSIGYLAGVKNKDYIEYNPTSKKLYNLQHNQNGSVIRMKEMRESREKHQQEKPYTSLPNLKSNLEKRQDTVKISQTLYTEHATAAYPHLNKQFQEDNMLSSIKVNIKPKPVHQTTFLKISQVEPAKPKKEAQTKDAFMTTEQKSEGRVQNVKTQNGNEQEDHVFFQSTDRTVPMPDAANLDLNQYSDNNTKSRESVKLRQTSQRVDDDVFQQSDFFPVEQKMHESQLTEQSGQWTIKQKVSRQFGKSGTTFISQSSKEFAKESEATRRRYEKQKQNFAIEINTRGYESAAEVMNEESQLNFMSEILKSYGRYVSKPGFQAKRFKKLPRFNIFFGKNSNENYAKNYISLNNQVISYLAQELGVGQDEVNSSIIKGFKTAGKSPTHLDHDHKEGFKTVNQELVIVTEEQRTEDPFDKVLLVKNIDNAILTSFRTLKKQNNVFTDTMKVIHQKFLPLEGSNQKSQHYKIAKLYRHAQSLLYPVSEQEDNFNEIEMCVEIPSQQVCGMEIKPFKLQNKVDQLVGDSEELVTRFLSIDSVIQESKNHQTVVKPQEESIEKWDTENQSPKEMSVILVNGQQMKNASQRLHTENTNRTIIESDQKKTSMNVVHSVNFTIKPQTQGHVQKFNVYSKVNREPAAYYNDQSVSNQPSNGQFDYLPATENPTDQKSESDTKKSLQRLAGRQYQFNDYINQNSQKSSSLKTESPGPQIGLGGFKLRQQKKPSKIASPGRIMIQRNSTTPNLPIIEKQTESTNCIKQGSSREQPAFQLESENLDKNSILNALTTPQDNDQLAVLMSTEGQMISVKVDKVQAKARNESENETIAKKILNKQSAATSYQLRGMINNLYQNEINSVYKKIEREANIDKFSKIFNLSSLPTVDAMFRGDDQRKSKDLSEKSIVVGGTKAGLHTQQKVQKMSQKQGK